MTYWAETWSGPNGAPWNGWSVVGYGTTSTTIQGNAGRLAAGGVSYAWLRARYQAMADQRDVNLLLSFTPTVGAGEWYLTVGVRNPSNDSAASPSAGRGLFAQIRNIFGNAVTLFRVDADGTSTSLGSATLPTFTAGVAYRTRVRVDGQRLRVRVWQASLTEPSTWAVDVTDPLIVVDAGKVSLGYITNAAGDPQYLDVDSLSVAGLDPVPATPPTSRAPRQWSMWSRAGDYSDDLQLPIAAVKGVKRHVGINRAAVATVYTPERWESLQPSRGLVLYRDGRQEFTGLVAKRAQTWDADTGQLRIHVEAVSDEQHLADRIVFPDPLRAADDQTVNDYWTYTGLASAAMRQLISDQAGPTCHPDRQVSGLVLGADPGVGVSRGWSGLFTSAGDNGVLDQLAAISIASGENLGLRVTSAAGSLTFDIVEPRDLADEVRFSADMRNLVGYEYSEEAPTCTDAVSAGQGDLHLRLRKHVTTASVLALAWGRRIFKYVDRRDTADVTELTKEATDAVVEGDAKVSLAVTLTDSQAATYGVDWDLGDRITVYVAPPGQGSSIAVADVVREVVFEVNDKGAEKITPAVGTWAATALPTSPSQLQLAAVGTDLASLKARK